MDYLREGVHLRAMAQKDPLVEYRHEGHVMFEELGRNIREEVVQSLFHVQVRIEEAQELEHESVDGNVAYEHETAAGAEAIAAAGAAPRPANRLAASGSSATPLSPGGAAVATAPAQRVASDHEKLGRNDPCWCGSGKKFKKCHGA
jgi:preprotein translocase subunit SecA